MPRKLFIGKEEVEIGRKVMINGLQAEVTGMTEPHKPSSTGRVEVRYEGSEFKQEYFPGVIGAEWRDDE